MYEKINEKDILLQLGLLSGDDYRVPCENPIYPSVIAPVEDRGKKIVKSVIFEILAFVIAYLIFIFITANILWIPL